MVLLVDAEMNRYEPVSRVDRKGLVIDECSFCWFLFCLWLLIEVTGSDLDNAPSVVGSLFIHMSG